MLRRVMRGGGSGVFFPATLFAKILISGFFSPFFPILCSFFYFREGEELSSFPSVDRNSRKKPRIVIFAHCKTSFITTQPPVEHNITKIMQVNRKNIKTTGKKGKLIR